MFFFGIYARFPFSSINDLPDVAKNCKVALFADDTKIHSCVSNYTDCENVQSDLDALCKWSVTWHLSVDASKCKVLSVSKSKNQVILNYMLQGMTLERVREYVDLGVTVDCDLNWNAHVKKVVSKSNKVLGMIKRSIGYSASVNVKKQLYVSLVRCHLEYCVPV